jgi:hypothetical protein
LQEACSAPRIACDPPPPKEAREVFEITPLRLRIAIYFVAAYIALC